MLITELQAKISAWKLINSTLLAENKELQTKIEKYENTLLTISNCPNTSCTSCCNPNFAYEKEEWFGCLVNIAKQALEVKTNGIKL